MNIKDLSRVLDEISQERVPQDLNLLPGVLAQILKGNQSTMKPKNKLALTGLLMMAVLVILFFSLPGVVSSMRTMLGFIPGIGMVDQTLPLRVLANPVTDTRDGFTITVENAVIDSEHSVITYKVEGPFETSTAQPDGVLSDVCFDAAELRLPDGTAFRAAEDLPDATWASGYRVQNSYPVIPADIDQVTFFLPCLHARLTGHGPENWEVPLSFVPAPPDLTVYPVTGQTTPTAEAVSAVPATKPSHGINLKLDSVIPLPDGQLVQTRLDWRDNPKINGVTLYPEDVKIFDASGREVAFEPSTDAIDQNESDQQSTLYGYKIAAIEASGPARLVVSAASEVAYNASSTFIFDPGPNRQPDQVWELNKDLEIDGHVLRILTVTVTEMDGNASLSVDMESADGIIGAGVFDTKHPALSGASGGATGVSSGVDDPIQSFWTSFNYDGGLPEGPITLTVTGYTVRLAGLWVVEWTPTAATLTNPAPIAQSQAERQSACLSESAWKAALAAPQPIPAELNQKILFEGYNAGTSTSYLSTARLDSSEILPLIENGHTASVSPDGSRVVYMGPDGVNVYNLSTAVREPIPGTNTITGVFRPFWSPDGQKIGYTGTPDSTSPNIYLANLDGSSPTLLETGEPLKLMQGWLPDGRILYVTLDENGPILKLIDPQSGETTSLFHVPQLATPITLSRNGERLALNWLEQPDGKQILYVFTPDGSQRKPLLELNSDGYIGNMLWAPDGNWLLVDLSWNVPNEPYTKALVQVDTCRIIPVLNLEGSVLGWLP